jgi:hypothetical protein
MYGSPILPLRKFAASVCDCIPATFIMLTIISCIALCNVLNPCPGKFAAAKFLPYLSSYCPAFPKNLPTIGAMTGDAVLLPA